MQRLGIGQPTVSSDLHQNFTVFPFPLKNYLKIERNYIKAEQ